MKKILSLVRIILFPNHLIRDYSPPLRRQLQKQPWKVGVAQITITNWEAYAIELE